MLGTYYVCDVWYYYDQLSYAALGEKNHVVCGFFLHYFYMKISLELNW